MTDKKYDTDDLAEAAAQARRAPFALVKEWLGVLTVICALVGAAYLSVYRLGEMEKKVAALETQVQAKASSAQMGNIRDSLGNVQLDVALMCSEMVRARGGNPLSECQTSRGMRSR